MVTATVQCKRHQRERSDRSGDVLQIRAHPTHPTAPLGGQGWSLGPGGTRSSRSSQRECHKVPVLVSTPGRGTALSPPLECPPSLSPPGPSPKDALAGHLWDEREGGNGVGNAAPGWVPPNPPSSHLGVAPPEWGHRSEFYSVLEHGRRRMPRPGWHQGPVQRWHWLAEGP